MLKHVCSIAGWRGFLFNFILGGLAVLGHAPFYFWPITVLCFAAFMLRLDGASESARSVRSGFWTGFGFGLGYFLFGFYWIGSAFIARGAGFVAVMPFAIVLFASGLAMFWGVAGALYLRLSNHSAWRAGVFACLLFIAEFARGHVFGGLPWNLPGYVFAAGQPVSQIANIVGIYGVSALVIFLAVGLALVISERRFVPFVIGLIVFASVYAYGAVRLRSAPIADIEYVENVKLRIVHADISQQDKFDDSKYVEIANHYMRLSAKEGFDDVTHVIWPEGAVPGLMFEDRGLMGAIADIMLSGRGDPPVFIAQTLRAERRVNQDTNYYNSAAAVTFSQIDPPQFTSFYDKQRLVPFGEFMPGGKLVEKLNIPSLSAAMRSMQHGITGDVPLLPGLPPVSLQICYEIIFPGFTPKTVTPKSLKPEWILNVSNDSWYGDSSGPRQHINQARYRAIEQGLPIVRSTSGGISGTIDPYGRQLTQIGINEDGILDTTLPRPLQKTMYSGWINFMIFLLSCGGLLLSFLGVRRAR